MSVLTGPSATFRAAKLLLSHPRLIPLALIPSLITCAVSVVGILLAVSYGDELVTQIWKEPESGWLHWLWWGAIQLVRVSSALLAIFITPWLVILFGVPLSGPLAAATDEVLGGDEVDAPLLERLSNTVFVAVCVSAVGIIGSLILLFLSWLPVIGLVMGLIAGFIWTPMILCYDLYDGAMSRRQASIRQRVQTVVGRPITSLSLGLTGLWLLSVPVVNLVGLPLAIISGVIVIRDLEEKGLVDFKERGEPENSSAIT